MDNKHLIQGPILKSIIALAVPVLIGNLLQTAYQLTDTFWVGRISAEAVAAVSLSFPIIFFFISFAGGIGMAGAVFVAQYKGKGDSEQVNNITGQTLMMALVTSAVFSVIGFLLTPWIIKGFGAEPGVIPDAVTYLRYSFLGLVFVFGFMVFQSLVRGVGDAKTPAYIVLVTVLLNAVLDPLFIFGFGFGVAGAAISTLFTQAIALIIGIMLLLKGHSGIYLKWKYFAPNFSLIKKIVKLGLPISFEQSSRSLGFILMTVLVASFGTTVLAGYGIGMRMISLVIIPALSLAIANSALVGQNIGAGNIDRAEKIAKTSGYLGFIFLTIIGLFVFIFSKEISTFFIPNDPEVIALSSLMLYLSSLTFGFIGIQMAVFGTLRGAGHTLATMFIALTAMAVQLSIALFLSKYTILADFGLWISFPISNVFACFVALFIFFQGKWKKIEIIETK